MYNTWFHLHKSLVKYTEKNNQRLLGSKERAREAAKKSTGYLGSDEDTVFIADSLIGIYIC